MRGLSMLQLIVYSLSITAEIRTFLMRVLRKESSHATAVFEHHFLNGFVAIPMLIPEPNREPKIGTPANGFL